MLLPAGTTALLEPPGVVDLAQTSTELLEVWAPVQAPEREEEEEQLFVTATAGRDEKRIIPTAVTPINRNFVLTKSHSIQ